MTITKSALVASIVAAISLVPQLAVAEEYPHKPIRMIVGFPPGGGADIIARLVSEQLGGKLGTQIVVDNRPGAGSSTATGIAAKADGDGYTIFFATASFTINPNLYKRVPYDPIKDFVPISKVASSPFVVVARPSLQANTVKELLALAKSKPGQLNYSTGGNGSTGHLAGELLKSMAGVQIQHVPYKGLAPALADLLGGRVDLTMSSLPSCIAFLKRGKLKALAVTSAKRTPLLPSVATVAESGLDGYDVDQWYGVFAPRGTPPQIVNKLNIALAAFLSKPDESITERFASLGATPLVSTPKDFRAYVVSNLAYWEKAVQQANAKVE